MKTLENRLFHLFEPGDVARAREIIPAKVSCPRVGQVRAIVSGGDDEDHEVFLELSAHRRGGMTLETRCSSNEGKAGKPCAILAAVILEIDRRGLFSGIHDQTPVALEVIGETPGDDEPLVDDTEAPAPELSTTLTSPANGRANRNGPRLAPWAAELEERRRLVEPTMRSHGVSIPDTRRAGGALVFLFEAAASTDARAAVLTPCRMQLDVTGNATGRPRPITIGPGEVELTDLDGIERELLAKLLGSVGSTDGAMPPPLERRTISRLVISAHSAATHLAMLCEAGRLVIQPEPRRAPEEIVPLAWDSGRPWELAFLVGPDDDELPRSTRATDDDEPPKKPSKATLTAALVRGSQRKSLDEPRVILKAGIVVFADRIARLEASESTAWIDQFERRGTIELSASQCDGLVERLAMLADVPRVVLPAWTGWRIESGPPHPKLVLDDTPAVSVDEPESGRRRTAARVQLAGQIWFDYAGVLIAAGDPAGGAADADRRVFIRRDRAAERDALAMLPRYGFTPPRGVAVDGGELAHHVEVARGRLDSSVSQLASVGWTVEVAGRRYRPAGSVAWNVTSGIDWFELSAEIDFGGVRAELPALLEALASGGRSVVLSDGSVGILPDAFATEMAPFLALAQKHDGTLRYGRIQLALLDALLAGQPQAHFDEAFERLRDQLAAGGRPEAEQEPHGFEGTLRHYQREGLGWLVFLESLGLGGCLADDMGLGKTIQVLAMLMRRQVVNEAAGIPHRPSLVVVPKSLVFNWIEEAHKFAPSLRVANHTGNARTDTTDNLADFDMVITTYGTLRRDIVRHRENEFDYVILDEAQSIKNAASQAAKACRLLRARHRLALTGTPVENHIGELWSIFEFLNPGQLGSAVRLRKFLADGRGSADVVARAVRPYLLRRTKKEVLSDLPEKTEQTLYVELGETQRKAYDELREHFRAELTGRIGRFGIGRSRIAVLEALLRLRQTACHPGLVDHARVDEPSAKLDTLLEQLEEVIDEGHKVIVFSQFTSFLSILRRRLDAIPTTYEYLDGRTTDRQARVTRFQEDESCRLFLVSLKAGGQGLNLTAADYIYILDPWWNPAVEAQAVDRAHRIGQTRPVFAYRLIARDTVEEKILSLQDKKRELAESIVRADAGVIANLTPEDVELLLS